ncbi:mycothiol synthase [Kitasatospora sp. MAP12-15]|uniref:mycothiol synthase n=1 Tax=unclassified Kitasatospora TaxID=2633591 RepID=UPI002473210D|nr:mycothiol synthase [Kitasatospora sp. MAP12-44]MDH6112193.1 mycothiol synthase [Kitasatospora sp. MAP12-44]
MDATTGASPEEQQSAVIAQPELPSELRDGALRILAAAVEVDGREAVSEQGRIRLRSSGTARPGITHLVQPDVGYAQLEAPADAAVPTAELVVTPQQRQRGHGRRLLDAVLAQVVGPVDFWAHGGHPGARHLADRYGAELVRELRQMRRSEPSGEPSGGPSTDDVPFPAGVTLRTFRPGVDDEQWLRLNALAFAHHPEQGSWTAQDLADRIAEPWFDPAGFFLAYRGEQLVGFHWTKVHPATEAEPALGEVYVVGVDPAEQGNGLGRALTAAGLRHLARDRGLSTVLLYVDADNPAAVRVYERLGFAIHEVDLVYRVQSGATAG